MPREPGSRRRIFKDDPATNTTGPKPVDPHSPWQLMIEENREEKKISIRELATRAQISHASLYNWLRNKSGGPSRISYSANLNRRMAKGLGIDPESLAAAYNESMQKPLDPSAIEEARAPRPAPRNPQETFAVDGLERFLATLKASGRQSFTIAELHQLAAFILPQNPGSQAT